MPYKIQVRDAWGAWRDDLSPTFPDKPAADNWAIEMRKAWRRETYTAAGCTSYEAVRVKPA